MAPACDRQIKWESIQLTHSSFVVAGSAGWLSLPWGRQGPEGLHQRLGETLMGTRQAWSKPQTSSCSHHPETSAPKWLTLPKSQDSTSTLGPSAPAPLRPPAGPGSSSPLPGGASHGPYWAMALWPSPGLCLTPVCLCRVSSRPTSPWHLHCLATLTHLMCRNAFVLCCKVPNPNVTPNHTPSISVLLSLPFFCTLKFY